MWIGGDKFMLNMCNSDILTTVYGSVSEQRICWITTNQELRELYKISDFAADNKRRRLEWLVIMSKTEQKKKTKRRQKNRDKAQTKMVGKCKRQFTRVENEEMKAKDREYRSVKVLREPYRQWMSKKIYSVQAAHNSVLSPPADINIQLRWTLHNRYLSLKATIKQTNLSIKIWTENFKDMRYKYSTIGCPWATTLTWRWGLDDLVT